MTDCRVAPSRFTASPRTTVPFPAFTVRRWACTGLLQTMTPRAFVVLLVALCCCGLLRSQSAVASPASINFGNVTTGATSQSQTVTFTFSGPATLGSTPFGVYTQTSLDHEFSATVSQPSSACQPSHPYSLGNTCTVQVSLAPTRPGLLLGAVQLLDGNGAALASLPLSGVGTGPMLTFAAQGASTVYSGSPVRVATDRAGDVFIAESIAASGNGTVKLLVASGGVIPSTATPVLLAANFGVISSLAVDGSGNVFVADSGTGTIKEIVATTGSYVSSPAVNTVYTGTPLALAVDGAGNLLFTEGSALKRIAAVSGQITSASPVTTIASGFSNAGGLAVDGAGNVYVADTGNNAVKVVAAVAGIVTSASTVTPLFNSGTPVQDIAVDPAGDLFISLYGQNVFGLQAVNGSVTQNGPSYYLVGTPLPSIRGLAFSPRGDIYLADDVANKVLLLAGGTPPTMTFAAAKPPATSSDSPQAVTYADSGNAPLTLSVPASGTNPTTPTDFTLQGTGGCPVLTPTAAMANTLAPGARCTLDVSFQPTVAGPILETTSFTSDSLNAAGSMTAETLVGFGLGSLGTGGIIAPGFSSFTTYVNTTDTQTASALLYNLTSSAISLTTPSLSDPADFSANDTCGGSIPANGQCSVTFTFHPTSIGTLTSTYTIGDPSFPSAPVTLQLSAVSVAAQIDARGTYSVKLSPALAGVPVGLSLDQHGDLYFAELLSGTGYVLASLPGVNGAVALSAAAQQFPAAGTGVAVATTDDQGNVYYLDNGQRTLNELPATNGTVPVSATPITLVQFNTGAGLDGNLVTDHLGDIFFETTADQYPYNYEFLQEAVAVNGAVAASNPTIVTLQTESNQYGGPGVHIGGNTIGALAVNRANDLFYEEGETENLNRLAAVNGVIPPNPQPEVQGAAPGKYGAPFLIDSNGDAIYTHTYLDSNSKGVTQILKVLAVGGAIPQYPSVQLLYTAPTLQFRPSGMVQDASGNVFISDQASKTIVELSPGAVVVGGVSISPTMQIFPSTKVGQSSSSLVSTITNTSSAAVTLTTGSLTDATDFTESDSCGGTVGANSLCTVTFLFTPQTGGALKSTYSIADVNHPSAPLTVALSGTGVAANTAAPAASLTPATFSFAATATGSTSAAATFTLANTGNAPLPLSGVTVTGAGAAQFGIAENGCAGTVAAGSTCAVQVAFTPVNAGTVTATLSVADSVGTQTAALTGTGVAATTPPDFTIGATPASQSGYRGAAVTYTVQLNSASAANPYTAAVALSVTGLPLGASATFSPSSVVPGTGATATLSVQIPSLYASNAQPHIRQWQISGVVTAGLLMLLLPLRRARNIRLLLVLFALALCGTAVTGCGNGNGFAVPTTQSTLTISGTGTSTTHSTTVSLTVQ